MSSELIFRELTLKNILAFGNTPTAIDLSGGLLTVVLGINYDTGGEDSRNGVGKSAILDALCYVLFGEVTRPDTNNQALVNKWARKGQAMLVTLRFDKGDYAYLIERGEKPSRLSFFRKPIDSEEDFHTKKDDNKTYKFDRSRGKGKKETTDEIIDLLGYDLTLFEYLVANSSESIEFFKLKEEQRRAVFESLLGLTMWAVKAKKLKDKRRDLNKDLTSAKSAADATKAANQRVEREISELKDKSSSWARKRKNVIAELKETIELMESVDASEELELLKLADEATTRLKQLNIEIRSAKDKAGAARTTAGTLEREEKSNKKVAQEAEDALKKLDESACPTCKQHWEPDPSVREGYQDALSEATKIVQEAGAAKTQAQKEAEETDALVVELRHEKEELEQSLAEIESQELTYETIEEAAGAGAALKGHRDKLTEAETEEDPYADSIASMKENALKPVDESDVKEFEKVIKHYNFLIDLLTQKDSFLRQDVFSRWLPKINNRLGYWLDVLELPHTVEFQPDLTVVISNCGQDFTYGNLSKGQRNRVRIAMNLAFQDVFEHMNYRINLLAVDELVDTGICPRGAENAVSAFKEMGSRRDKRIFLITHRDDIAARVDDIMTVTLRDNQSRIEWDRNT